MPTLQFKGKNIIWNHHLAVPFHTLDEVPELNYQSEKANGNMIIEGDNLIVLKALLPQFAGKINAIYIDPPYNTGNEGWIYNDKVNSPLIKDWIGKEVSKDDLTRHDKWLCMMVPRLKLLFQLLSESGVIFISIDDNELSNLISFCNEIFGEENFLLTFCWRRTDNQSNIGNFARVKEYILAFAKDRNLVNFEKMELSEIAKNEYRYEDAKGKFRRQNLIDNTRGRRYFNVTTPSGRIIEGPWMAEENEINRLIQQDAVYWANGDTPYGKLYLQDSEGQITSDWLDKEFGTNQRGSDEINELFGKRVFDFPKPTKLITHFVKISNSKNIVRGFKSFCPCK